MLLNPGVLLLWESLRLPCVCHALNRISGGLKGNQNIERPDSLLSSRGRDFYAGLDRADPVDRLYDMIWYMVWFGIWYGVVWHGGLLLIQQADGKRLISIVSTSCSSHITQINSRSTLQVFVSQYLKANSNALSKYIYASLFMSGASAN